MRFVIGRRCASTTASVMKAWILESHGTQLQLREMPIPVLTKPDQVLIKVKVFTYIVMAVIPAFKQGCHAEYAITEASCCSHFQQAASFPYVACTAWTALVTVARMNPKSKPAERVLIHGGSGGLGTMAIQMLKAWGTEKVVATCSQDSFELVKSLGAIPVDYRAINATDQLINLAPFEVVLDCVNSELAKWSDKVNKVVDVAKTKFSLY
uniref:ADH_zinc_N domain-containing protein n=1 Tax=Heterorhabditis bacteriophora TaxID=37862 RepID=A0A1I7XR60_HETBA